MDVSFLPPVNATLNGIAAVLLVCGFVAVKRRRLETHKRFMLAAFAVSAAFLACYLFYHIAKQVQEGQGHTTFRGTGLPRVIYLIILVTHLILAIVNLPMVIVTLYYGLRSRFEQHRRWAKRTLPIWLYVSVTGVVVYLMLYQLYPAS